MKIRMGIKNLNVLLNQKMKILLVKGGKGEDKHYKLLISRQLMEQLFKTTYGTTFGTVV